MAGPMQKVKRGDPLVIPAATFNTLIDAARDFQQRQRDQHRDAHRDRPDTGIVLVRNESGADRERFDVLGINGPIIERVDNEDEFKQRVALRGVVPSSPHPGKFAVLLEPAKDQAIVRACVDGVCVVRVRMVNEAHTSADIAVGVASRLESADSGTARLLWVEPLADRQDPQIAWTVARIGGGGGAAEVARYVDNYADVRSGGGTVYPRHALTTRAVAPTGLPDPNSTPELVWVHTYPGAGADLSVCVPNFLYGARIVLARRVPVNVLGNLFYNSPDHDGVSVLLASAVALEAGL